jgi:lysophospholipase L1-like esterase
MTAPVTLGTYALGDVPPPLVYSFLDSTGVPIDLSGGYSAAFTCQEHDGPPFSGTAEVTSGPAGQVTYTWAGGEFPTQGRYTAYFWADNGTNRITSVPINFLVQYTEDPFDVPAPTTYLEAANDLSDVGSPAAALANLDGTPVSTVVSVSAPAVTGTAWQVLEVNAATQPVAVTLPAPAAGVRLTVKKMDSTTNAVSVIGTVDGTVNPSLTHQYGSMELVGNGTAFLREVRPSLTSLVDYPATSDARYVGTSAWRRRDLPDQVTADSLYAGTAPVITTTLGSTSTISGAQALMAPNTGPFTYLGAGDFAFGTAFPDTTMYLPLSKYPNTYASGQAVWSVEFATDAQLVELLFKYIGATTLYRLSIDGRKTTDLMQSTGAGTAGSRYTLKFDFGSAAPRRIRFDFLSMPFGGLFVGAASTVWQVAPLGGRLGVLGDSITDGSAYNTGAGSGTWLLRAARLLGCTDVWDQARGGTGYITPGAYAVFDARIAQDIAPYGFDRLIVWGGYNDNTGSQSAIAAAAAQVFADLKAAAPAAAVTVFGCWSPSGTAASSVIATDSTLQAAALAAGLPFVSPITGNVYSAAGAQVFTSGPWITAANASTYVNSTDNVHPNDAGHVYLARRITQSLFALMAA